MDITVHIIRGCLQLPGCLVLKNSKGAKVNLGTNLVKDLDHPGPSVAIGLVQNAHYLGRAPPTFPRNLPTIVLLRNAPTIHRFSCLSSTTPEESMFFQSVFLRSVPDLRVV